MQVTAVADHITHAVIGGAAETIEFGVSSSAALMHMLSTALYSDQPLAVAREVLCNAWDSHIRAGKEHVAISVSITETKLIVRDFGSGIAPDMMGPLYGTYGGTDKLNNGSETGGFGLGCKAPFSYTNHFEVISWYGGHKTIYNMSKSSADKFGKPGITPIVTLPSTETGIQVTIPVKNINDMHTFIKLFSRIARNGEMNVEINSTKIEGLPLSTAEHGWIATTDRVSDTSHALYVRYGNVIYPIENSVEYADAFSKALTFLQMLRGHGYTPSYSLVLQAEPDTISVTPSRESLQFQEHTCNTLKGLLTAFNKCFPLLNDKIQAEAEIILESQIQKVSKSGVITDLLSTSKQIPGLSNEDSNNISPISNINDVAKQCVTKSYPASSAFYRKDMGMRLDALVQLGIGKRGHLNSIKHAIQHKLAKRYGAIRDKNGHWSTTNQAYGWFKRTIIRPLYRDLAAIPELSLKRFWVYQRNSRWTETCFVEPVKYRKSALFEYTPLLRNIVVLTYSKNDLYARCHAACPELENLGGLEQSWVYHAPHAKTRIQATRDFFTSRGFILIDLTVEEEIAKVKGAKPLPDPNKIKKPKLTGYAALSGVYYSDGPMRVENCFIEGSPRISAPVFYHSITYCKAEVTYFNLGRFDPVASRIIAQLFGDVCAVVRTKPQQEKLKGQGLMDLDGYVSDYILKKVTTDPNFIAYWSEDINRAFGNTDGKPQGSIERHKDIVTLFDCEEIRTAMGLTQSLNEHDIMVLLLWRTMSDFRHYESIKLNPGTLTVEEAKKAITALPVSQNILDIAGKSKSNEFIEMFDVDQFKRLARQPNAKAKGLFDRMAKLVKIALLG